MNTEIINILSGTVKKSNIITAIHYGNKKGVDVDILIIVNNKTFYERRVEGKIDITMVGIDYVDYLLSVFDPIVTEPFITGKVVFGKDITNYKLRLASLISNRNVQTHLLDFAKQIYQSIDENLKNNDLDKAIINIVFCLSYLHFMRYYEKSKNVIIFKKLLTLNQGSLLSISYAYMKKEELNNKEIYALLSKTKLLLEENIDNFKQGC